MLQRTLTTCVRETKPPKGSGKKKLAVAAESDPSTPPVPTLAEQLSYLHYARPFKNPYYTKNVNRRAKNLKAVLTQERERERVERERRRQEREERMEVDGATEDDVPEEDLPTYSSIEAPPSVLPQRKYCDVTGLEGPYTDPATGLRYHDKSIYELIKSLSTSAAKDYLSARGVNPIVK
ncbi:hypothetical protein PHLGIDRAFT_128609 [Phlebiopsis gigantea 11061_1 CR5-6]|uniref:Vps72/YL1 C-terminal domain-containing protein n=1 Tax=Phlebiopsis gigantea (strain 11061_1 CR5-6) TaxID=745531 RepID=A0A0C3RWG1_PHLG1|nr:hypothetical protein PHLGIDRAFT_128609 [Phlebiopsis gigantea 11061_1 CR5-6]